MEKYLLFLEIKTYNTEIFTQNELIRRIKTMILKKLDKVDIKFSPKSIINPILTLY